MFQISSSSVAPAVPREPMTVVDFPDQLRNDVFYCQRALKEHIKIHQFCAVQQAIKPRKRYAKMIRCIEVEIQDIVKDQRKVIDMMRGHLRGIHNKMERNLQSDEYDNKIIGSYLDMHRASLAGLVLRASGFVKSRATEKELIKNFGLLADLQKFMRPTALIDRQLLPVSPVKPIRPKLENGTAAADNGPVSESRRKFMAALQFAKKQPQTQPITLDSDNDDMDDDDGCVAFLSEEPLYPPSRVAEFLQQQQLQERLKVDGRTTLKKTRGRPKKCKIGLWKNKNSNSAPSTRPGSPVAMPYVYLPEEREETNDYDQQGFLLRFGLYTLEMSERLKTRRPERRRRNVQSTENKDFHYGQIEMLTRDRPGLLGKQKKPMQQYLSPKTFKKRRTYDRSASSSPPNEICTCNIRVSSSPCPKCARKLV